MAEGARVESIEALGRFRNAMIKFAEAVDVALADAEGELSRTSVWLETEQLAFWQTQLRHRHEAVEKAKEAVRMKKLFKDASGRTPSAVEEEKALKLAQRRLEEAEQKLSATRKYAKVLQREFQLYKGGVQRLSTTLADAIPTGVATLSRFVDQLHRYVGFGPATAGSEAAPVDAATSGSGAETGGDSMARPAPETSSNVDEPRPSGSGSSVDEPRPSGSGSEEQPAAPDQSSAKQRVPPGSLLPGAATTAAHGATSCPVAPESTRGRPEPESPSAPSVEGETIPAGHSERSEEPPVEGEQTPRSARGDEAGTEWSSSKEP
jgi:hypothetical protein